MLVVHKHQVTYLIIAKVMSLEHWLAPNLPTSHNSSGVSAVWWKKKGEIITHVNIWWSLLCTYVNAFLFFFLWFDEEVILQSVQKIDYKSARVLKYPEERERVSLLCAVSILFYTRFTFCDENVSSVCICKSHHHSATVYLVVVTVMLSSCFWVGFSAFAM